MTGMQSDEKNSTEMKNEACLRHITVGATLRGRPILIDYLVNSKEVKSNDRSGGLLPPSVIHAELLIYMAFR